MAKPRRVGILTGGGDCPGLNAVIRAVVRSGTLEHGLEIVGIEEGFEGLMTRRAYPLTLANVRGILPKGGTILRTTNRGNPFSYPAPDDPTRSVDRSDEAIATIRELEIESLILVGGDGTLGIGQKLMAKGVPVVCVPKTIDNDLAATDYTFGFWTAVEIATEAVDRLHSTAESHNRVMILEVMGRNAGWIALYAGMGGGADIILIPEIPYRVEAITNAIRERSSHGAAFAIIVVAEGAKREGGEEVYVERGSRRLGGVAYQVAADIGTAIALETRVTVLGHVQRGGSPIPFDRILATRLGKAAVDLVAARNFGTMVALRQDAIVPVPIESAVSRPKFVEPHGEVARTALSLGISFGDGR
ncbi:MAG TPA: ATP-dependent 6-phosphofructokinase [Thermoanaerobaculia bacterium]|nr:ATP-dependent 6-phosphofructokinase [Thermoanaerobaculia bacterium]